MSSSPPQPFDFELTARHGRPGSISAEGFWDAGYLLSYTNSGQFSVYKFNPSGGPTAVRNWSASPAILAGDWNTLKVIAVGNSLKFYINGTLVWSGSDSTLKVGQVGFGFYRDAASGVMLVDWAKATNTPTADPNTFGDVAPGDEIGGGTIDQSP
mgnify:CR=1 FL=1